MRLTVLLLAFASLSIRSLCEDAAKADAELGPAVAQALRRRLADLRAAMSPSDLIVGSPRVFQDGDHEYMSVTIADRVQLRFAPNHVKNPRNPANHIDWAKVSRVKIVEIAT